MALKLMNDGTTDISAAADGALYNFKTKGDYVFRGIGNEFAAVYSPTSRVVTIQSGEGVCGGRHVTEKKVGSANSQITLPANSSGYLSIRIRGGAYQDCLLRAAATLDHGDINAGALVRDLPLYAYVTSANGIVSFIDIRPITTGNGYVLRLEGDGELYADYTVNGQKRHRKIKTKTIETIDELTEYSIFMPANAPSNYISSNSVGNRGDILNITTDQFLSTFYDGFVSSPPYDTTVTKQSLGKDQSGLYDIYEYTFTPRNYNRTILLSAGLHAYELPASFGLANFIKNLYGIASNQAFEYIRTHVRVKVIPIANPWGFNQNPKSYGNVNGVNPNRNFDINGRWADYISTDAWNQKGDYPFSEAETRVFAKWADDNSTADFWIDCHTDNGSNAYDLDVYSLSASKIATQIANGVDRIEDWFAETYNVTPVTKHLLDSDGSIRQYWSEGAAGVPTFTLEQSPRRTTFGTAAQNSAADIANYCTNLSTFVQELLLQEYVVDTVIPITSATDPADITLNPSGGVYSATVSATVTPSNTTQNKFSWVSSNESVAKVYGATSTCVVVGIASGTATITGTNIYNSNITISFDVTVPTMETIAAKICGMSTSFGTDTVSTARVSTDMISVNPSTQYTITAPSSLYIGARLFDADGVNLYEYYNRAFGDLSASTVTGTTPSNAHTMRLLFKKSSGADFSSSDFPFNITINGSLYQVENTSTTSYNSTILRAKIGGLTAAAGVYTSNTARAVTDLTHFGFQRTVEVTCTNGYYLKAFNYRWDYSTGNITYNSNKSFGNLTESTISGYVNGTQEGYFRIVFKKPTDTAFTSAEVLNITGTIDGVPFTVIESEEAD